MTGKTNPPPKTIDGKIRNKQDSINYLKDENRRLGNEIGVLFDEREALKVRRDTTKNLTEKPGLQTQIDAKLTEMNAKEKQQGKNRSKITKLEGEISDLEAQKGGEPLDTEYNQQQVPQKTPFDHPKRGGPESITENTGNRYDGSRNNTEVGEPERRFPLSQTTYPIQSSIEQPANGTQFVTPLQTNDTTPILTTNNRGLPPLVRLDGQSLKPEENMYPAMAYRENVHQAWPEEAINLAAKRYPDLPKKVAASRELVPDSPDDLHDPDYYPLPDNPTFKDQFYHGVWREKKQGKL